MTHFSRPDIILPKIQQYRLIAFLNCDNLLQNSALLGIYNVKKELIGPLCAILNSSISVLTRLIYSRILGNEGNIQLDVYSARMMLVPNMAQCSIDLVNKIQNAFKKMLERNVLSFVFQKRRLRQMSYAQRGKKAELNSLTDISELDAPGRWDLDNAVLELIGVESEKDRVEIIERLYRFLREYFERTRRKEEKAIENKLKYKARGPLKPHEIATEIYQMIMDNETQLLKQYDPDFLCHSRPFDTFDIPSKGVPESLSSLFVRNGIIFRNRQKIISEIVLNSPEQAPLMILLWETGIRGLVRVPHEKDECLRVQREYCDFINNRYKRIMEMIGDRTSDENTQEKIYYELLTRIVKCYPA